MLRTYGNKKLCVLDCLTEYLRRRKEKIDESVTKLIIKYGKPSKIASADIIRRCVRGLFQTSSIVGFTAHSCPSVSTSKAESLEIDKPLVL